jgi:hypothetical protein
MFTKIKNRMLAKLVALLLVFAGFISCNPEDLQNPDNPTGKSILQFSFKKELNTNLKEDVAATISGTNIAVSLPYGTAVTALKPSITFFAKSVSPAPETAQDFTNPVKYTVTANDGSTQIYTVTVKILAQEYGGTLKIGNETISLNNLVPKYSAYYLSQGNYNLSFYDSDGNQILLVQLNGVNDGKVVDITTTPDNGWHPYIAIDPIGDAYYYAYPGSNPASSGTLKITRTPNTSEFSINLDITVDGTKIIGSYKGIFTNEEYL